jgi:CYTH domain-containing protein
VITIKGPRRGIARAEYEYEIPLADGELIMSNIYGEETLEKQRYLVEHAGTIWHIDVVCEMRTNFLFLEDDSRRQWCTKRFGLSCALSIDACVRLDG